LSQGASTKNQTGARFAVVWEREAESLRLLQSQLLATHQVIVKDGRYTNPMFRNAPTPRLEKCRDQ
jgi:hypothetical protein